MNWDYEKNVDLSITGYVKEALHHYNNKTMKNPQNQPYRDPERIYGTDAQKMKPIDTSPSLPTEQVNKIERKIGKLFYYARGQTKIASSPVKYTENKK